MMMPEKIFARAFEKPQLNPGENVWVNVDVLMTHDVCGPGSSFVASVLTSSGKILVAEATTVAMAICIDHHSSNDVSYISSRS
ncbi:unnamed protein product, partial [Ilex paraguariensis]